MYGFPRSAMQRPTRYTWDGDIIARETLGHQTSLYEQVAVRYFYFPILRIDGGKSSENHAVFEFCSV